MHIVWSLADFEFSQTDLIPIRYWIGKACINGADNLGRERSNNTTVWGAIETDERTISKYNYHADRNSSKPFATLKPIMDSFDLHKTITSPKIISDEAESNDNPREDLTSDSNTDNDTDDANDNTQEDIHFRSKKLRDAFLNYAESESELFLTHFNNSAAA